jgi:chromate transporter
MVASKLVAEPISTPRVPFAEAARFWTKLGFINFGGPAGQIAILHREVVERRKWVDEERFLHALNFCMLLPGPEAQQLATYVGWLMHGWRGGVVAGALFVLPSVFVLLGLSWIYVEHGDLAPVAALFAGLQPAVVALVASAALRIGRRALRSRLKIAVAIAAFVAIRFGGVPFPLILAAASLIGWFPSERAGDAVLAGAHTGAISSRRTLATVAICAALWWSPVLAAGLLLGWSGVHVAQGLFFSKAAMVTFGGAYAVLPYVAEHAVNRYAWLEPREMLDGLGLAETTPGPLIMVVQFVGFLGGWRQHGELPPGASAVLAALLTTWVTFLPSFLWVFAGAPYIERLRGMTRLSAAMAMISAAVVGVVLDLALWFGQRALWPELDAPQWVPIAVAVVAFAGQQWWKWEAALVVGGCALLGLARWAAAV